MESNTQGKISLLPRTLQRFCKTIIMETAILCLTASEDEPTPTSRLAYRAGPTTLGTAIPSDPSYCMTEAWKFIAAIAWAAKKIIGGECLWEKEYIIQPGKYSYQGYGHGYCHRLCSSRFSSRKGPDCHSRTCFCKGTTTQSAPPPQFRTVNGDKSIKMIRHPYMPDTATADLFLFQSGEVGPGRPLAVPRRPHDEAEGGRPNHP
jgi:hypothetical protein